MARSISVIIPNYNGRHLLEMILPDLVVALKKLPAAYEIIVADDASTDDSVHFIKTNYPGLIITENTMNAGFSVTANIGAAIAKNELLFFLNNDVKLTENYFLSLLKYFDKKDTFGVTGRVIGWNDDKVQDAAKLPYFQGAKLKTSRNYFYTDRFPAEVFTFYLTGSNALIDRIKFREIGGFNEVFSPFYCEDLELSVRAWRAGWKCYYEHNALCRHKVSATTSSFKKKKYVDIIYNRNKFIFHYLHLNRFEFLFYLMQVFIEMIFKLLILNASYYRSFRLFMKEVTAESGRKKYLKQYRNKDVKGILSFINQSLEDSSESISYFKS